MTPTERRIRRSAAGRKILDAVRAAQAKGFTIVDGGDVRSTGPDKCCCALQALDTSMRDDFVGAAETRLYWANGDAWIFAMGFDGEAVKHAKKSLRCEQITAADFKRHRNLFDLGRAFRRLLLPEERLVKT